MKYKQVNVNQELYEKFCNKYNSSSVRLFIEKILEKAINDKQFFIDIYFGGLDNE